METFKGTVKTVRKDKLGILLDNDKWYSNSFLKKPVECNKGDLVEVSVNEKGYLNSVTVLTPAPTITTQIDDRREIRFNVDAGNLTQRAVELTIAIIQNSGENSQDAVKVLDYCAEECVKQFKKIRKSLESDKE